MDTPRGTRCLRLDFPVYELAGARVVTASKDYPCDYHVCDFDVSKGEDHVLTSTGLRFCNLHFDASDIVSLTPRGV
jgi:hypothetical protein